MAILADLIANLRLNAQDFIAGLDEAQSKFEGAASGMEDAAKGLEGTTTSVFGKMGDEIESVGPSLVNLGKGLTELGTALVVGGAAITELTDKLKDIAVESVTLAGSLELSSAALTVFFGDAQTTADVLEQIKGIDSKSLFQFPELVSAAQRLAALGIEADKIPGILNSATLAATGLGGASGSIDTLISAISRIEATGTLSQRALMQLGITWKDIATQMGTSATDAKEQISKGLLGTQEIIDTVTATINVKYQGMADVIQTSVPMALKRVSDAWEEVMIQLGTSLAPVAKAIAAQLVEVINAVGKVVDWFSELPTPVQEGALAFAGLVAVMGPLTLALGGFLFSAGEILEAIPRIVEGIDALSASLLGAEAISGVGEVLLAIAAAVAVVALAFQAWKLPEVQQAVNDLGEAMQKFWEEIKPGVDTVIAFGEALLKIVGDAAASALQAAWAGLVEVAKALWGWLTDLYQTALVPLGKAFMDVLDALSPLLPVLKVLGETLIALVAIGVVEAFNAFKTALQITAAVVSEMASLLSSALTVEMKLLADTATNVGFIFQNIVKPALDFAIGGLQKLLEWVEKIPGMKSVVDGLTGGFNDLKDGIVGAMNDAANSAKPLTDSLEKVKSSLDSTVETAHKYSAAAQEVINEQEKANEKVAQTKKAYEELSAAYAAGAVNIDVVNRAFDEYNKALSAADLASANHKTILNDLKQVQNDLAAAYKTLVVPSIMSVADAEANLANAQLNQQSSIAGLQKVEADLEALRSGKVLPTNKTLAQLSEQKSAAEEQEKITSQALKLAQDELNKSKSNALAATAELDKAEQAYTGAMKALGIPVVLTYQQALEGVADARKQLMADMLAETQAEVAYNAAQASGDPNKIAAAKQALDAIEKKLTQDIKDLSNAQKEQTTSEQKLFQAQEQLNKDTQLYDDVINRNLRPHLVDFASALNDVREKKQAVLDTGKAMIEADSWYNTLIQAQTGDVDAERQAEERRKTTRIAFNTATRQLGDSEQNVSKQFGVSQQALDNLNNSTDAAIVKAQNADAALSAMGLDPIQHLQDLADTADQAFKTIHDSAISNSESALKAQIEDIQAHINLEKASGETIPADQQIMLAKLLQQEKDYQTNSVTRWGTFYNTVHDGFVNLSNDMISNLFTGKESFGQIAIGELQKLAIAVTEQFLKPVTDAISKFVATTLTDLITGKNGLNDVLTSIKSIGQAFKDIFSGTASNIATPPFSTTSGIPGIGGGGGGGLAGSIPTGVGGDTAATAAGIPGLGEGSGVAGAALSASLTAVVGAVGAVVSAIGSIGSWIEGIRQEGTMNAIEQHTKVMAIAMTGIAEPWDKIGDQSTTMIGILSDARYKIQDLRDAFSSWYKDLMDRLNVDLDGLQMRLQRYVEVDFPAFATALLQNGITVTAVTGTVTTTSTITAPSTTGSAPAPTAPTSPSNTTAVTDAAAQQQLADITSKQKDVNTVLEHLQATYQQATDQLNSDLNSRDAAANLVDSIQKQIQTANAALQSMQDKVVTNPVERDSIARQIAGLQQALIGADPAMRAQIASQIADLEAQLSVNPAQQQAITNQIADLQTKLVKAQTDLVDTQKALKDDLAAQDKISKEIAGTQQQLADVTTQLTALTAAANAPASAPSVTTPASTTPPANPPAPTNPKLVTTLSFVDLPPDRHQPSTGGPTAPRSTNPFVNTPLSPPRQPGTDWFTGLPPAGRVNVTPIAPEGATVTQVPQPKDTTPAPIAYGSQVPEAIPVPTQGATAVIVPAGGPAPATTPAPAPTTTGTETVSTGMLALVSRIADAVDKVVNELSGVLSAMGSLSSSLSGMHFDSIAGRVDQVTQAVTVQTPVLQSIAVKIDALAERPIQVDLHLDGEQVASVLVRNQEERRGLIPPTFA